MNHKTKQNKTKNPSADTCSTLKARSINIGYQHGHSQTTATHTKKEANMATNGMLCHLHTKHKDKMTSKTGGERDTETGKPATCYIGQECRCHGNQQPSIGIWSSVWNYCRGFDVQYTSGVS